MNTISVVVAAYNAERYIKAAIDSILAQTHRANEVIVVDDGSTDATNRILQEYGSDIRLLRQANEGSSSASNKGIKLASGNLLAFLDADDLWPRNKLELQLAVLKQRPEVEAVFGMARQFISEDLTPEETRRHVHRTEAQPGISKNTMLIRREVFGRIGYFDSNFRYIEFLDWYLRAIESGLRAEILPEVLTERRLHNTNTGLISRNTQRAENLLAIKRSLDRRRIAAGGNVIPSKGK